MRAMGPSRATSKGTMATGMEGVVPEGFRYSQYRPSDRLCESMCCANVEPDPVNERPADPSNEGSASFRVKTCKVEKERSNLVATLSHRRQTWTNEKARTRTENPLYPSYWQARPGPHGPGR